MLYLKFFVYVYVSIFLKINFIYFIKGNFKKVNVKNYQFKIFNFEYKYIGEVNF